MAQIERGEAKIQRRISIKRALDCKVGSGVLVHAIHCFGVPVGMVFLRSFSVRNCNETVVENNSRQRYRIMMMKTLISM